MQRFNQTTLRANDLTFSALEQGSGPVVLCLHGFPDHPRTFRFQLPALAGAGFRAIAPSLRGYDPSSQPPDRDYHVVRMAEDVVGWIDDLGQDRVHLIGHDWGGVIGYAACAMAPERFRSLTTLGIPHPGRLRSPRAASGAAPGTDLRLRSLRPAGHGVVGRGLSPTARQRRARGYGRAKR